MVRKFFASVFGKRFAFEIALLIGVLIVSVNEYTYRTTTTVLRGGITLTDERISAGRLLQALTDAETGQRGYLLTQDASFLAPYKKAIAELPKLRAVVVPLLDLHNPLSASEINDMIDSRLSEMATTIKLTERGSVQLALDIVKAGAGSQWMSSLTQMLNDELAGAANRQSVARISIYDAIAVNHAAVILLTLSSVLALYVFIRQLRLQEQERQAQEARLEATIEKRTVELRELAQHLQTVREAEKDHLARELHDQLGALLTVAKLELEGLRKRVQTEPDLTARVERVGSRINEVIVVKRRMVEDMRPSALSMLGLRSALVQHCREMAEAMNVPFHVDIDEVSLTPESELVIYRFVQEALTNIAKYSNAKNVWVELHNGDKRLDILVRDDGVGFDPDLALAGHHGLTGMRYRIDSLGGTMSLTSRPGGGTSIRATIAV
jgi:signal transduction histidine kinase